MLVQELAEAAGVSARSVRHYERAGLIAARRLPNGYRAFDAEAVEQVRTVKRLIASGLTVRDIAALRPCLTADGEFNGCEDARRTLERHIERLSSSIERDRQTLRLLDERRRNMSARVPRGEGAESSPGR